MTVILKRIAFAVRYRTTKKMVVPASDPSTLYVFHKGQVIRRGRRCPHQGAPLETGYCEGDELVCPWHGCRFSLTGKNAGDPKPVQPGR